jgi:hypothetical protein
MVNTSSECVPFGIKNFPPFFPHFFWHFLLHDVQEVLLPLENQRRQQVLSRPLKQEQGRRGMRRWQERERVSRANALGLGVGVGVV